MVCESSYHDPYVDPRVSSPLNDEGPSGLANLQKPVWRKGDMADLGSVGSAWSM